MVRIDGFVGIVAIRAAMRRRQIGVAILVVVTLTIVTWSIPSYQISVAPGLMVASVSRRRFRRARCCRSHRHLGRNRSFYRSFGRHHRTKSRWHRINGLVGIRAVRSRIGIAVVAIAILVVVTFAIIILVDTVVPNLGDTRIDRFVGIVAIRSRMGIASIAIAILVVIVFVIAILVDAVVPHLGGRIDQRI